MSPGRMARAVEVIAGRAKTEASGRVTLKNIRKVAQTGVDYVSVGAITHSAPAVDIAMDMHLP
jgi:nicotinate-nucleotide pyrophosphorylase (carboxylating)